MAVSEKALTLDVSEKAGSVSAVLERPRGAKALYVLAHGAGAGMHHAFMAGIAELLHARKVATLRFQFPYTERGGKRPDPQKWLLATVEAAVVAGRKAMRGAAVFAGGKSMGGRMTSILAAADPPSPAAQALAGLVFLGFPLHAPGKDGTERAAHLSAITVPTLFVQGTRDKLARFDLITEVVDDLPQGQIHVIEEGDHSFNVPKRSGRTKDEVWTDIADAVSAFVLRGQ